MKNHKAKIVLAFQHALFPKSLAYATWEFLFSKSFSQYVSKIPKPFNLKFLPSCFFSATGVIKSSQDILTTLVNLWHQDLSHLDEQGTLNFHPPLSWSNVRIAGFSAHVFSAPLLSNDFNSCTIADW